MKDKDNIILNMGAIADKAIPLGQLHNLVLRMSDMEPGQRVCYGDLDASRDGNTITVTKRKESK